MIAAGIKRQFKVRQQGGYDTITLLYLTDNGVVLDSLDIAVVDREDEMTAADIVARAAQMPPDEAMRFVSGCGVPLAWNRF